MINNEYHDEKHVDAQKFNENYVINESHEHFMNISVKQTKIYIYRRCQIEFYFNNKLYRHWRSYQIISVKFITLLTKRFFIYQIFIIQSNVKLNVQFNFDFQS